MAAAGEHGAQMAEMMAQQKAAEQLGGLGSSTQALLGQQARDLAFAKAQQQAAWRQSAANMGLSLAQQIGRAHV